VGELARGVQGVVLDHHGADAQCRVERDHVRRAVGEGDRDAVAGLDPEREERTRGEVDLNRELAVRRGASLEVDGHPIGERRRRARQGA